MKFPRFLIRSVIKKIQKKEKLKRELKRKKLELQIKKKKDILSELEDYIKQSIAQLPNLPYMPIIQPAQPVVVYSSAAVPSSSVVYPREEQTEKKEYKKRPKEEAVEIPSVEFTIPSKPERIKTYLNLEVSEDKEINLIYPVTKDVIHGKEHVFAYARIRYEESLQSLIYEAIEPKLPDKYWEVIHKTLHELENRLDVPYENIADANKAKKYLMDKIYTIWDILDVNIPKKIEPYVLYYIFRETIGYGKIDPLMNDPYIEDISCDGVNVPIFVFHRNPYIGEIQTNIVFTSEEELDSFVMKLAIKTGRPLSVAQPLLDGALPDGSRVQITYGKDIARKGSSFTIRKFTKDPFTPVDLLNFGTVDLPMLAYLWTLVEEGKSILISGGTATGKTSFLNAICLFIKPEKKIVSIEDTQELRLPHPNWLPQVSRQGFGPQRYGEVSMIDLLKAALRQRPDYIIVGEVRGQEAYVLFQAMATGHTGMGTIHADTFEALIDRLTSPPINLPPVLLETLHAIVFLRRVRYKNKHVRRVDAIYEIVGYDNKSKEILRNISFKWDPKTDTFIKMKSVLLKDIMEFRNWTLDELNSNLQFKVKVLEYLWKKGIRHYKEVDKYIRLYYTNPKKLAEIISVES